MGKILTFKIFNDLLPYDYSNVFCGCIKLKASKLTFNMNIFLGARGPQAQETSTVNLKEAHVS